MHYVIIDHETMRWLLERAVISPPRAGPRMTDPWMRYRRLRRSHVMTNVEASPAITLDQEIGRREELADRYTGIHFLEDMGAGIFGKAKGENVLLIALHYRVGGSVWGVDDTIINNTTFHAAPYDRQKIENNDFISHRIDPIHRADNYTITRETDRVVWQAGDRAIIARPPLLGHQGRTPRRRCRYHHGANRRT
jgi:hypothetical protein